MIFKFMHKPRTPPVFWALMLFWVSLPGDVFAAIDDVREIVIRSSFGSPGNIIQIAEVVAIDAVDNTDVALSALGATAIARQTYQGNSLLGATNTIDGNAGPGAADGSYYHSADETDQWLKITLPEDRSLKQIELVGRGSCCSDRDIFDVTVLNADGDVLARRFHLDGRQCDAQSGDRFRRC